MPFTNSKATDEALAGFTAGFVSTISLHPLDLLKTKLQVNESSMKSLGPTIRSISSQGVKGFYAGMSPNLLGATASWGIYFFWYSLLKDSYSTTQRLQPHQHLLASGLAGALTSLVTNPIWVVKTRMFTQPQTTNRYRNVFDGLHKLWKQEGVKGYYKGIVPALFGVSHGAIQFMVYEQLKLLVDGKGTGEYIAMACTSKVVATVCTYPYQVVKSRMQTNQELLKGRYDSVTKTILSIYRNEKRGFYKGMGVNLIRVLPGTCITFAVYEFLSGHFALVR
jgi:solute carrier family 25 (mitochondrial folate transporter), member 32